MQIAIIGAGNVGTALATSFVRAGHDVVIASRDPEDATSAAAASGARIASSNLAAIDGADVIIPAVYFPNLPEIAAEIATAAAGIPVVDVSNRISFGAAGGLAFLNMALNIVNEGAWQSGWKLVGAPLTAPVAA